MSVRHPGDPLGTRTEVKNISSVRFVSQAIGMYHFVYEAVLDNAVCQLALIQSLFVAYEIKRQIDMVESGSEVKNETRNFDFETG